MCLSSKVALIVALAAVGFPSARANNSTDEDEYGNMVVGGFKVDTEAVPYQVALFRGDSLICGGTIIGPRWVLTSYHCVNSMNSSQFFVVVGTDKPREGRKIPVVDIFLHPDVEHNQLYDMALLKLAKPLQFDKKVNCVQLLQSPEAIVEGKPAYISGFGSTSEFAHDSPLKAATVDLLPWEVCAKTYPFLMQHFMICAGFKGGKVDSCQGDSGGPLVMDVASEREQNSGLPDLECSSTRGVQGPLLHIRFGTLPDLSLVTILMVMRGSELFRTSPAVPAAAIKGSRHAQKRPRTIHQLNRAAPKPMAFVLGTVGPRERESGGGGDHTDLFSCACGNFVSPDRAQ
uniref:Peptidase S1 domain-containing protein n=1 Tax=Anopheles farauti TaxID=69004 RepID=A0A182QEL0_9DIPT